MSILAADIGGTKIALGRVDDAGVLTGDVTLRDTPAREGGAAVLAVLVDGLKELLDDNVQAVGIASAGFIDPKTGTVAGATSSISDWVGTPLAAAARQAAGRPVSVVGSVLRTTMGDRAGSWLVVGGQIQPAARCRSHGAMSASSMAPLRRLGGTERAGLDGHPLGQTPRLLFTWRSPDLTTGLMRPSRPQTLRAVRPMSPGYPDADPTCRSISTQTTSVQSVKSEGVMTVSTSIVGDEVPLTACTTPITIDAIPTTAIAHPSQVGKRRLTATAMP